MIFFSKKPSNVFKAPTFWTFCWFLLFQSHGSAKMVPLAIFKENSHIFRKTHLVFFIKKPKISTFWEISLIKLPPTASLRPFAVSKKLKTFFSRKQSFFSKRIQFLNTSRNLNISVAFYSKFATFSIFWKKSHVFSKNTYVLFIKTKFWTFWGVLLIQSHFTANLLLLAVLKKFKYSSEKPIYFFFRQ